MFSYSSLLSRRRLEGFLNSEPKEVKPKHEEKLLKDSFIRKTIDYFTEKSDPWLDYADGKIRYKHPRTFLGDIENIKNYFGNLFSRD
jgi:hypothetical protein